jgi:hypothetical protein
MGEQNIWTWRIVYLAFAAITFQVTVLFWFGQPPICECGYVKLWEGVVLSVGNSQHISDWYTFSHMIHGVLFFFIFSALFPRLSIGWRFLIALGLEVGWEILENTPYVINWYRQQALAQGYVGDSILNSVSDTIAMVMGYIAARHISLKTAVIIIVIAELFTLYMIRDSLALNMIGFVFQFDFIASWQNGM